MPDHENSETLGDIPAETQAAADVPRAVSEKRRAANQAAALKSTGPKTPEGKRRAAFNSFEHGAFAREDHVLHEALGRAGYDAGAFDARRQELLDDWQPAGAQQRQVIGDLAWLYWLRDRARAALLEKQARAVPRLELERDWRRFNARHRAPSFNHSDFFPDGCVVAEDAPGKPAVTLKYLARMEACVRQGRWSAKLDAGGTTLQTLAEFVYGTRPSTERGRQFAELRQELECARPQAKPGDARALKLLALIEEETAALAEEEALAARQKALEVERPEAASWPELRPLGEEWQALERRLQQIERQVDAKIRLLLRLEKRAREKAKESGPLSKPDEPGELYEPHEHNEPYKPYESGGLAQGLSDRGLFNGGRTELVARTSVAQVRGLSPWAQAADLRYAGPRYPLTRLAEFTLSEAEGLATLSRQERAKSQDFFPLPVGEGARRRRAGEGVVATGRSLSRGLAIGNHQGPTAHKTVPWLPAATQIRGTNPRGPLESMAGAFGPAWETACAGLPGAAISRQGAAARL